MHRIVGLTKHTYGLNWLRVFSETRISLFPNENDELCVAMLLACQAFDFHPFTNEDNFSVIRNCLLMPFLPLRETRNQLPANKLRALVRCRL